MYRQWAALTPGPAAASDAAGRVRQDVPCGQLRHAAGWLGGGTHVLRLCRTSTAAGHGSQRADLPGTQ